MARTIRNAKIDSRTARAKLLPNKAGYWVSMAQGCALGYRKGTKGGRWLARIIRDDGRREITIAESDDFFDPDDHRILSYTQAQDRARVWFTTPTPSGEPAPEPAAPYTVNLAADDYLAVYEAGQTKGGGKGKAETRAAIDAFVKPLLGVRLVSELTLEIVERWHREIAMMPPRKRAKKGQPAAYREVDMTDPDVIRQRRATANRILTVLKAILNRLPREKRAGNEHAWIDVKPFREVDAPTIRWIEPSEAKRLLNAAPNDLKTLMIAALFTGCRYGELGRMKVKDFSSAARGVHVLVSKGAKPRFIALTDEGCHFFIEQCAGKETSAPLFTKSDGRVWGKSEQHRGITIASIDAGISPPIGFHILRHSYGSWLAMRGVPLVVIAKQLGHVDTRMTERHYAHLAPSYIGDTVRAAFGDMGLVAETNLVSLAIPCTDGLLPAEN